MIPRSSIVDSRKIFGNRWVSLIENDVETGGVVEQYYGLEVPDYVAIVARTPSGKIPLIRQFRPAVGDSILELPAGTVERGETPLECCVRELLEETGLTALSVCNLGSFVPDSGRLLNRQHIFQVQTTEPDPNFIPEPGSEIRFVEASELEALIGEGKFPHLLHIAALYLVWLSSQADNR